MILLLYYSDNPAEYKRGTIWDYSSAINRDRKVLSLYTAYVDLAGKKVAPFSENMKEEFGEFGILILNRQEFFQRVHNALVANNFLKESYHNTKDAVSEFAKKYNCDLALAEEYLKVVRGIRNQQPFYVTDEDGEETGEDVALDDTWNYTDILWNGIQAEKVQRAFEKLNFREQTLLEKRLAICMTCGRVGSWKNRPIFEELAVMFEGSTASGAERAYRKAVDKLTAFLVAEGALHAVRLKQKSKTKHKKKIAAAIYEYQVDCDGEWGEISFDFENGRAEILRLADWDTVKTNRFANRAIAYLLSCENEKLPKETMVAFEV